jgi:hypothetical protein
LPNALDAWRTLALQSAIEAMRLDERLELVEYRERAVEAAPIEVSEEQRAMNPVAGGRTSGRSVDRPDLQRAGCPDGLARWK